MKQIPGQISLFSAEASRDHANHLVLPGSNEARKMTATSGQKWLGLSRNSGPLGSLEKMLLESLEWHSPIFFLNWGGMDIGQGHFLYRLVLSEPDTDDIELQLWATPNTMDYLPQRSPEALERQANGARKGRKRPANLREQVNPETVSAWEEPKIWKTPVAADAANREMYVNSRGEPNLSGQVKLWPTPKASDCKGTGPVGSKSAEHDLERGNLRAAVLYPTPSTGAGLCGGTGNFKQLKKLETDGVISEEERKNMSQGNGGQLNPYWVEWLMGLPIGWTEI